MSRVRNEAIYEASFEVKGFEDKTPPLTPKRQLAQLIDCSLFDMRLLLFWFYRR